ncbi:MAG: glycosyltransferase family 1 protein [Anaerolineae bacterium]|nr:glycosyltransferase family 1 protein [Anaerolineae bacterium]
MKGNRLLQAQAQLDAEEIAQVFGHEDDLLPTADQIDPAPLKRVALITESFFPKVDGVAKSAYMTLRYLQKTGREVIVFAPDIAPTQVGGSRVVPLPSLGLPFAPETRVALPNLSIARWLEYFKPDLVHMFSPAIMSVSGMLAGRRQTIPIIANYQTDLPGYTHDYGYDFLASPLQGWLRYIHNGCHLTLVPSSQTEQQLDQHGYKRMRIWGRGVDLDRFNPRHRSEEVRARLLQGRDPDSTICLYVGRVATEKRLDLLLEVAKLPGVVLTIVGDGAVREDVEVMFEGTGTVFTGYMYGEDLSSMYASADVFVFPGPRETFGQVVQEALASGLPGVIINQGGIVDLVTHGVNGFHCPADSRAFAEAVAVLLNDPVLYQQMSKAARRQAETRPWTAIMAQLEEYYKEAVTMSRQQNVLEQSLLYPRWNIPHQMSS